MSAWLRAGASLRPSPVMATILPSFWAALTSASLSSGSRRYLTSVSGTVLANSRAASLLSPVRRMQSRPLSFRSVSVFSASGLGGSMSSSEPRYFLFMAAWMPRSLSGAVTPCSFKKAKVPIMSSALSEFLVPLMPLPGTASKLEQGSGFRPRLLASEVTALAIGCSEYCSREAIARSVAS